MGKENVCDINDLIEVRFNRLNLGQLLFVQAVLAPEIAYVIDKYADAILELGESDD